MSAEDLLDMFAELPRVVQVAILSHLHSFRSRGYIQFTDYPRHVADYISASGLLKVTISDYGLIRFYPNEHTTLMREHIGKLLQMTNDPAR